MVHTFQYNSETRDIHRIKRKIKKNVRKMQEDPKTLSFKPIDDIIGRCFEIHRVLEKSNNILHRFHNELEDMSTHLDHIYLNNNEDAITVDLNNDEEEKIIDHRFLFDNGNVRDKFFDEEYVEKSFKREISNYISDKKNKINDPQDLGKKVNPTTRSTYNVQKLKKDSNSCYFEKDSLSI